MLGCYICFAITIILAINIDPVSNFGIELVPMVIIVLHLHNRPICWLELGEGVPLKSGVLAICADCVQECLAIKNGGIYGQIVVKFDHF